MTGGVIEVHKGAVNSTVVVDIGCGHILTSVITNDAVDDLRLAKGDTVTLVVKSSDVMIAK